MSAHCHWGRERPPATARSTCVWACRTQASRGDQANTHTQTPSLAVKLLGRQVDQMYISHVPVGLTFLTLRTPMPHPAKVSS